MAKRIVFVGCVGEGKEALHEILRCGGNVVGIFTFTDELAMRTSGAVSFEDLSEEFKIPLFKVKSTNDRNTIQLIGELAPDVIFVVGWTRLLSKEVLDVPTIGCFGFHASLLPKYRGRAPVNWAIINGEELTGNSMMILDEGVDTGDLIAQRNISISISDTCATLYDKVSESGREMIREVLHELESGTINRTVQRDKEAAVMAKRKPEDGIIEWARSGLDIYNWVRALTHPYPGAFTYFNKKKLYIWDVRLAHYSLEIDYKSARTHDSGTIIGFDEGIIVLAGNEEIISIQRVSYGSDSDLKWDEFAHKYSVKELDRFEAPVS